MPVTTIYLSTTNGAVESHLVWGDDFYWFFTFLLFLVFSVIFLCFLFSWILYSFLFGFAYIFKCFWSQTAQGMRGSRFPPPFLVREFSVLTRLKKYSRQSGRLPRSELPFRAGGLGLIRALMWASARRGMLVNGSAGHDVKKE